MMTKWDVSGRNVAREEVKKENQENNMITLTEHNSPIRRRRGGIRKHET
jgi:hypothetical protein